MEINRVINDQDHLSSVLILHCQLVSNSIVFVCMCYYADYVRTIRF